MSTLKKIKRKRKNMHKKKTNKISQLSHTSHMSTRKVSRISIGVGLPNKKWYTYPFSVIEPLDSIFTKLIGEKETFEDAGDFPNNISNYIWGEEGENDFVDWILLCKLSNGKYAYYTAWCDYTGFDCQGGMKLYISSKLKTLVKMAMDDKNRSKYLSFIKHK
jgi:hypothetical protein